MENLIRKSMAMLLAVFFGAAVVACQEDEPASFGPTAQDQRAAQQLTDFFANSLESFQQFTGDPSVEENFVSDAGIRITIPPNSLVDTSGNAIAGSYEVLVRDMMTPDQVIFNNAFTVSDDHILVSGGQFEWSIRQGSQELSIAANSSLRVQVPADSILDPNMDLFVADGRDDDGAVDWESADVAGQDTTTMDTAQVGLVFQGNAVYDIRLFEFFNWINCDYFWNHPGPFTSVSADLPEYCNQFNTRVLIYFPNINSITEMGYFTNGLFDIGPYYNVPINTPVYFVAIYADGNGGYEFGLQSSTIQFNHVEQMTLEEATQQNMRDALQNL